LLKQAQQALPVVIMIDSFGREITYLRISLTDLCNLRCKYCMPEQGVCKKAHEDMMTLEEMIKGVKTALSLGIRKFRLTGGEPLLKKNIIDICRKISELEGVENLCITTNGVLLEKYAKDLKEAGVKGVNISLDTLDREKFLYMTGKDELESVKRGIKAALKEGFEKVKINTVLIGGFNDDEAEKLSKLTLQYPLDLRFIELMPMNREANFGKESFVPLDYLAASLKGLQKIDESSLSAEDKGSVAKLYKYEDGLGRVGFISAVSNHFCASCNRIRLTADGKIKPCLHSEREINIKGLDELSMKEAFKEAILNKPIAHGDLSFGNFTKSARSMNCIGG